MGEGAQRKEASYRSACTECARRKQKVTKPSAKSPIAITRISLCNREWPCNGCQKRKVADKCRFKDTNQPVVEKVSVERQRKNRVNIKSSPDSIDSELEDTASGGIDALGYMPSHLLFNLTSRHEEFVKDPTSFAQLERALGAIPSKPYTDILIQNFLNNVNYHYYIVYPPSFLEQYQQWWVSRAENRPLSVQWTCLLLTVCACASQYTDVELQAKLEGDLGHPIQRIAEQYHETARELASAIPLGHSHLTNVQQLLHSCYWFKSEARFVECWHVLNAAIREAQELSIHKEAKAGPLSELDLEMRRRVWCILDTWDCLIRQISGRFGHAKNVVAHADVQEYQRIVEAWVNTFPPPLSVHNPDRSLDTSCPWIVLHRHMMRTVAFTMLLQPIRGFLTRPFAIRSLEPELQIRSDGIDYCLELMVSLRGLFDHVYPRDARYHFVLFCIFDISTVLCSAVLHDEQHALPRRDDAYRAIDEAHAMLQSFRTVTKSAKASYGILTRIVQRLPRTTPSYETTGMRPKVLAPQVSEVAASPQITPPVGVSNQHNSPPMANFSPSPINIPTPGVPSPVYSLANGPPMTGDFPPPAVYTGPPQCGDWQPQLYMQDSVTFAPTQFTPQGAVFANISDEELGELANVWNYQSLDFSFINS
ncbi:hypothetical protein FSPOR_3995 [Fusarium sporotrichioides]|uniref:Xylanolytic transcriptional activator regulatory domain-containing protein n=1 Tax=Fusarium sporotrichioides TaxID=5514 RepID=A0A395SDH2_FUSSP|nr:hypothetical protein FSPOR_3995 [Fusarium sporotrichioides]